MHPWRAIGARRRAASEEPTPAVSRLAEQPHRRCSPKPSRSRPAISQCCPLLASLPAMANCRKCTQPAKPASPTVHLFRRNTSVCRFNPALLAPARRTVLLADLCCLRSSFSVSWGGNTAVRQLFLSRRPPFCSRRLFGRGYAAGVMRLPLKPREPTEPCCDIARLHKAPRLLAALADGARFVSTGPLFSGSSFHDRSP